MRAVYLVGALITVLPSACAPPCADVADIVESGDGFVSEGRVTSAVVDGGQAVIVMEDTAGPGGNQTIRFDLVVDRPPALPPLGATVNVGAANCFGEGCAESHWTVPDFFEVGTVGLLNDDADSIRPIGTRISAASPVASCDDGDPDTEPAAARIATDEGDMVLAAGEAQDVTIDGQEWVALGGHGERRSSFSLVPAVDGAGAGFSSVTRVTAVLYRRAP